MEIIGDELHLVGDATGRARILVQQPAYNPPELLALRGQFEVLSGHWLIRSGYNFNPAFHFIHAGPGRWRIAEPALIRHIAPGDFYMDILAVADGSEALFDFLTLNLVLSGATFMPSVATYAYVDYDGDNRQFTLPITDADAASHDARYTQVQALSTAIDGISKLARTRTDFVIERDETGAAKPSDQAAQVNIEWLVKYVDDTTGAVESVRIGGADLTLSGVLQPGSNVANLAQTEMAAFVTAFEAVVRSSAGNAVSVQSVEFRE